MTDNMYRQKKYTSAKLYFFNLDIGRSFTLHMCESTTWNAKFLGDKSFMKAPIAQERGFL